MALDCVVGGALIFFSMGTASKGKSHGGELSPTWNLFPQILYEVKCGKSNQCSCSSNFNQ